MLTIRQTEYCPRILEGIDVRFVHGLTKSSTTGTFDTFENLQQQWGGLFMLFLDQPEINTGVIAVLIAALMVAHYDLASLANGYRSTKLLYRDA